MQKLLALVMAALLLVSTTGVTVACMVCEQTGKPVTMCHRCDRASTGVSLSARSCCVNSTHHIAVVDSFTQPVQPIVLLPAAGVAHFSTNAAPHTSQLASAIAFSFPAPPSSVEYCALISNFRI